MDRIFPNVLNYVKPLDGESWLKYLMVETCEFPPLSTWKDSVCFTDLVRIFLFCTFATQVLKEEL